MKKSIFDRRIPTVFAILLLLGGLVVASVLIRQGVFTVSQASPEDEPRNVQIVNTTDTSFTVIFTTNTPTTAAINIQNTNPPTLVYDKRDTSGKTAFLTHFVTVTSLKPNAVYEFSILSNGKNYLDQGKLYATKTSSKPDSNASTYPLAGSILLPDGSAGADTLITVKIPNALPIGAVTDQQGNYRISSNNIRDLQTQEVIPLEPKTPIQISAMQKDAVSQVTYDYNPGDTIPPITLSNNYSFIASEEETPISTDEASLLALPTGSQRTTGLSVTTPKPNQTFIDSRPQFRGTATPNTTVRLVITSEETIEAQIKSDSLGNWAFRPNASIAPGTRTVTVSQSQPSAQRTVSFQVFASGSQIAESATPSATVTPTVRVTVPVTLTPTATLTPTGGITVTPTAVLVTSVPSITVTPIPTATPTITNVVITSPPQKTIPPTGNSAFTIVLTTLSIAFIVAGSAFLFML